TRGGRRSGAGRKVTPGRRPGVPHRRRPVHVAAQPVHVTLRVVEAIRCLRAARVFPHVRRALAVSSREDFRIIQFTVQNDHIHLIAEADTGRALSSGVRGLVIRIARAVNGALGRRGPVWGDRYHARALTTPRAVRNALVYVVTERAPGGQPAADWIFAAALFQRGTMRAPTSCTATMTATVMTPMAMAYSARP